jgi:hypothetical protein
MYLLSKNSNYFCSDPISVDPICPLLTAAPLLADPPDWLPSDSDPRSADVGGNMTGAEAEDRERGCTTVPVPRPNDSMHTDFLLHWLGLDW